MITDRATSGFDLESKQVGLESIQPSTTLEDLPSTVGVKPIGADDLPLIETPAPEETRLTRE